MTRKLSVSSRIVTITTWGGHPRYTGDPRKNECEPILLHELREPKGLVNHCPEILILING